MEFDDGDDFYADDDDQAYYNDEQFDVGNRSQPQLEDYTVLNQSDIARVVDEHISEVSAVLSVSKSEAITLLVHYNWSISQIHDAWFADPEIHTKTGLFENPVINFTQMTCGICFEDFEKQVTIAGACGHPYCTDCWRLYISAAIDDGFGCLKLRCPDPGCKAAVGRDMVEKLATEEGKKRYFTFLLNSYVETCKKIKWCPAAGCENAVDFIIGSENLDVSCNCSHQFCWNCTEEAHRPVDCKTVEKWNKKNTSESENVTYISAFTKPCPKCKKAIEKNQGCNHMTCRCGHHFCWTCLESWTKHDYNCNKFISENESVSKKAKEYLERYTHYYERWANNDAATKMAVKDLMETKQDEFLRIQCQEAGQVKFLTEAWQQIVSCRRVLKWTYAYGYFLEDAKKKEFFEYLQGEAESNLERLHHFAEKEVEPFFESKKPKEEFWALKQKLTHLTSVTKTYFENLITALQNGLSEMSSRHEHQYKDEDLPPVDELGRWFCRRCTFVNDSGADVRGSCRLGPWNCRQCTCGGNSTRARVCEVCRLPRDARSGWDDHN